MPDKKLNDEPMPELPEENDDTLPCGTPGEKDGGTTIPPIQPL